MKKRRAALLLLTGMIRIFLVEPTLVGQEPTKPHRRVKANAEVGGEVVPARVGGMGNLFSDHAEPWESLHWA